MLLITTADERYWKTDEEVLFLGEWCRLPHRTELWSKMDGQLLPYHWDDRSRFHADRESAKKISERCLSELVPALNELHQFKGSHRYWNILIGAWLADFVGICLDRYLSIRAAADLGGVKMVFLPALNHKDSVVPVMAGAHLHYLSPRFNNYLYGYITRELRPFPFRELPLEENPIVDQATSLVGRRHWAKTLVTSGWNRVLKFAPDSAKQISLVNSYLGGRDLFKISMKLGQLPVLDAGMGDCVGKTAYSETRWKGLKLSIGEGEFERLFAKLLPFQLPCTSVELFSTLQTRASEAFPRSTKVIFTSNLHGGSDALKMWTAQQAEAGCQLLLHQHGGNYGTALCSADEEHEIEIADRYYTWGWTKPGSKSVQPLPSAKLTGKARQLKGRDKGGILVGCDTVPLWFYRFASMPIAHQVMQFHSGYVRFFKSLSGLAYHLSLLRLYPVNFGWDEAAFYQKAVPDLSVYQGPESFYEQLARARLFVCGNNQTTYLETLAAGFPTIIFLDPGLWEIRPEARPLFQELEEAGICHFSPESAAAFVNTVVDDPGEWWRRSAVQEAAKRFCRHFASVDRDWLKIWKGQLTSALRASQVSRPVRRLIPFTPAR